MSVGEMEVSRKPGKGRESSKEEAFISTWGEGARESAAEKGILS